MEKIIRWTARNADNTIITSRSNSQSKPQLKLALFEQQLILKSSNSHSQHFISIRRWLNRKHSSFFLAQILVLSKIGLNPINAVKILEKSKHNALLQELLLCLKYQLSKGEALSNVLSLFPELFDDIIIQFIRSGETSGQIDKAFSQAHDYHQNQQAIINQLLTALLYPIILLVVSMGVLSILISFVIPQFEEIYAQSNNQLPWLTVYILNASDWLGSNALWLIAAILCVTALIIIVQRIKPFAWHKMIPLLPKLIRNLNTLKFCQTSAGLYCAGLTITDCLQACTKLSADPDYRLAIDKALNTIANGQSLSEALDQSHYFEDIMIQLLRTGEESASLETMLLQCSEYYSQNLNASFNRLKIMLEPILVVFIGLMIGVILVAMYLPVFDLGNSY